MRCSFTFAQYSATFMPYSLANLNETIGLLMRTFFTSFILGLLTATIGVAQTNNLEEIKTGNDARGWEAVGRLDIEGKGFCTATLIEPNLVLTAAHCLFDSTGNEQVDVSDIQFLAGLRHGRAEATRGVRSFLVHPSYDLHDTETFNRLRHDIALIVLDRPIRAPGIETFEISNTVLRGTEVGVISYAEGREEAPSLEQSCNLIGEQSGVLVMDCNVNFGASGSPVFRFENGQPRLVSIISAMAEVDGRDVSLAPDLAAPLPFMKTRIENLQDLFNQQSLDTPTSVRSLRVGERNDTGALFLRP